MRATFRLAVLAVALVVVTGCNYLTPKTYQLEHIHETYTTEWAQSNLPAAGDRPTVAGGADAFTSTLAAIRNYKATYGSDTSIAAHLTVLEGMIYVQSGKPGMARLLESDISAKLPALQSASGVAARDYVIARSFPHLVDGWEAILQRSSDVTTYTTAANEIVSDLVELSDAQRADAQVDSGGAYLATSAAIFYVWTNAVSPETHALSSVAKKGLGAIEPWLTAAERDAVANGTWDDAGMDWGSRQRYVEWYAWLRENAGAAAGDGS